MSRFAYYNGQFSTYENISIPLTDRSMFFGDAVYEVLIGRNGKIYQFNEHIERLLSSANALEINLAVPISDMLSIMRKLAENYHDEEFLVYVQLSRVSDRREHIYTSDAKSNLLVFTDTATIRESLVPISLISHNDLRYEYCNIKTVNLLPAVLASTAAHRMGADECVFVRNGYVTECAHSNIMFIKGDTLVAPPVSAHILPGITMQNVFKICEQSGIGIKRYDFSFSELTEADEILVTSTTKLARRVYKINGVPVGMKNAGLAHLISDRLLSDFTNNDC